jgi:hypothetical protein
MKTSKERVKLDENNEVAMSKCQKQMLGQKKSFKKKIEKNNFMLFT